jgi:peptidoglycan/xylan/chitin deacetylase (PgdA/CDA1 family)
MQKYLIPTILCLVFLSTAGCNMPLLVEQTPTPTASFTATPSSTPTPQPTTTATTTPTATLTPTGTPAPTWATFPAGSATVPILLYHHIGIKAEDRYYVTPDAFEQQMRWLYEHGYTAITVSQLAEVLLHGGLLPERPVVITFDDGAQDVYTTAFPIMQRYGFVGTFYLVVTYLGGDAFVTVDQVFEMIHAGWEIGTHSMTHTDLVIYASQMNYQLVESRTWLQQTFGVPVDTVAYPFGSADTNVFERTSRYGFNAGVGLGTGYNQDINNIFYLVREEVRATYDMNTFISLLPWQ